MRVIYDNFRSLPTIAQELAVAVRNDEQLNNLWSFETIAQGGINEVLLPQKKKAEVDPATTKMELYVGKLLDLLLKRNKRIKQIPN